MGASGYAQVSAAGVLAGLRGIASRAIGVGSPLGLVAPCPCMTLVPGPHLLKGSLDIATSRIPLGLSRLVFASVILIPITAGLLVGLWIGGAQLVADPPSRHFSILVDVPTAGILAIACGVYFGAPPRIWFSSRSASGGSSRSRPSASPRSSRCRRARRGRDGMSERFAAPDFQPGAVHRYWRALWPPMLGFAAGRVFGGFACEAVTWWAWTGPALISGLLATVVTKAGLALRLRREG